MRPWILLRRLWQGNGMSWSAYTTPGEVFGQASLACYGVGQQTGRLGRMIERELPSYALVIITEGNGNFRSASMTAPVRAPALIWLFPGVSHGYEPDVNGWTEYWLLFGGSCCAVFETLGLWDRSVPVVTLQSAPPALRSTFEKLRQAVDDPSALAQITVSVLAQQILLGAVRAAAPASDPPAGSRRILANFSALASTPMSMPERARHLEVSPAQLRTALRQTTGRNPHDFLMQLRLSRAQTMLVETEQTVASIAHQVGFEDPAYFSRFFARKVGVPPSEFRRSQVRGIAP